MARIYGQIIIDFSVGEVITEEQFDKFKKKLKDLTEEFEISVEDASSETIGDPEDFYSLMLDEDNLGYEN